MAAWGKLRALDQRFRDGDAELRFRRSLEPQVLRALAGLLACWLLATLVALSLAPHADLASFDVVLLVWMLVSLTWRFAALLFACARLRSGRFSAWNWELVAVGVLSSAAVPFALAQFASAPFLFPGGFFEQRGGSREATQALAILLYLTAVAHFFPVRARLLWLPLGLLVLSQTVAAGAGGAWAPVNVLLLWVLGFVTLTAVWAREQAERERWLCDQAVAELRRIAREAQDEELAACRDEKAAQQWAEAEHGILEATRKLDLINAGVALNLGGAVIGQALSRALPPKEPACESCADSTRPETSSPASKCRSPGGPADTAGEGLAHCAPPPAGPEQATAPGPTAGIPPSPAPGSRRRSRSRPAEARRPPQRRGTRRVVVPSLDLDRIGIDLEDIDLEASGEASGCSGGSAAEPGGGAASEQRLVAWAGAGQTNHGNCRAAAADAATECDAADCAEASSSCSTQQMTQEDSGRTCAAVVVGYGAASSSTARPPGDAPPSPSATRTPPASPGAVRGGGGGGADGMRQLSDCRRELEQCRRELERCRGELEQYREFCLVMMGRAVRGGAGGAGVEGDPRLPASGRQAAPLLPGLLTSCIPALDPDAAGPAPPDPGRPRHAVAEEEGARGLVRRCVDIWEGVLRAQEPTPPPPRWSPGATPRKRERAPAHLVVVQCSPGSRASSANAAAPPGAPGLAEAAAPVGSVAPPRSPRGAAEAGRASLLPPAGSPGSAADAAGAALVELGGSPGGAAEAAGVGFVAPMGSPGCTAEAGAAGRAASVDVGGGAAGAGEEALATPLASLGPAGQVVDAGGGEEVAVEAPLSGAPTGAEEEEEKEESGAACLVLVDAPADTREGTTSLCPKPDDAMKEDGASATDEPAPLQAAEPAAEDEPGDDVAADGGGECPGGGDLAAGRDGDAAGAPADDAAESAAGSGAPGGAADALPSVGAGKGGGKGRGKGPVPLGSGAAGKGTAKGKGQGAAKPKLRLGRRFHWRGLSAEQARGTVFDCCEELCGSGGALQLDLDSLQELFADLEGEEEAPMTARRSSSWSPMTPRLSMSGRRDEGAPRVTVFGDSRAQHVAIVLRRIFGLDTRLEDVEALADGLSRMALPPAMADALLATDGELLDLLFSALPTPDEAEALLAAAAQPLEDGELRAVEQLCLPLVRVRQVRVRVRALRLRAQAGYLQRGIMARVDRFALASQALRASAALRQALCAIAQLGSWINSEAPGAERGFVLSSGLGRLKQFRALRGDRDISLMHVVVLGVAGGDPTKVAAFGQQIGTDLEVVTQVAREDLRQLHSAVSAFRSEADWLVGEALDSLSAEEELPCRQALRDIHRGELGWRADELEAAWSGSRARWQETLAFFAEHVDPQVGFEPTAERLLQTVDVFRKEAQEAAREIAAQPDRFLQHLAPAELELALLEEGECEGPDGGLMLPAASRERATASGRRGRVRARSAFSALSPPSVGSPNANAAARVWSSFSSSSAVRATESR